MVYVNSIVYYATMNLIRLKVSLPPQQERHLEELFWHCLIKLGKTALSLAFSHNGAGKRILVSLLWPLEDLWLLYHFLLACYSFHLIW